MHFREEGDEVLSNWKVNEDFQGFKDVLHGGIQATLMDEIASWFVFAKLGSAGMTRELTTKYRKPVIISKGDIELRARLKDSRHGLAFIEVKLFDGEGQLCSESLATYFVFPEEKARTELHYPGKKAFYQEEK